MQKTIKSFLADVSQNSRWSQLKADLKKKLGGEYSRLKTSMAKGPWQAAEKNYSHLVKKLSLAQRQVDSEVQKTVKAIKKSAAEVEKTIKQYKAIALREKAQVKKAKGGGGGLRRGSRVGPATGKKKTVKVSTRTGRKKTARSIK